jgi:hypothetical protein
MNLRRLFGRCLHCSGPRDRKLGNINRAEQQAPNTECDVTRNTAVFRTRSSLHAASRSLGAKGAAHSAAAAAAAAVLGPAFKRTLYNVCTYIYNVTLRRVRVTIVAVEKQQVLHVLRVSVASDIHHAKHMRRIVLPRVVCPTLQYFATLFH